MKKIFSDSFLIQACWFFSVGFLFFGCSPRLIITASSPIDYPVYEREEVSQAKSLLRSADDQFKRGDIQAAYREAVQAINLDRSSADAYLLLGKIYHLVTKFPPAETCFRSCIQLDPKNAQAHYYLGLIRREEVDFGGAIAEFKKAIELAPLFAAAHFQLGAIYYGQGQLSPAEMEFAAVVFVKPDNTTAHKYLSNIYFSQGRQSFSAADYQKSQDYFQKSFENNNANINALYYLGHIYLRIPHYAEAAEQFKEMLKYNPDSKEARQMLASLSRKWPVEASPPAGRAKAVAPPILTPAQRDLSNNYFNDGQKAFSAGDYLKARDYFLKSVQENNANANALYYLGHTFLRTPHFSEAAEKFKEMLKYKPDSKEARHLLDSISRKWPVDTIP